MSLADILLMKEMAQITKEAGPMGVPLSVLYLPFVASNLSLETFYKFVNKITDTGLCVVRHDCLIWVAGENKEWS